MPVPAMTSDAIVEMLTVLAVAARPDDVEGAAGNLDAHRVAQHRLDESGHLADGLALGVQRDEEGGHRVSGASSLKTSSITHAASVASRSCFEIVA